MTSGPHDLISADGISIMQNVKVHDGPMFISLLKVPQCQTG